MIGPYHSWWSDEWAHSSSSVSINYIFFVLFFPLLFFFFVKCLFFASVVKRRKKTLIKPNKKKHTHKVGVLCMTFCCSGYGVHVSAAPCMMKSDEDSGLVVKKRRMCSRRWWDVRDVNWSCSWTTDWFREEIMLIKDILPLQSGFLCPLVQREK